ncbi:MAG: hypothetical protein FOGNACKC_02171 [Anaerolineae bacterium]|nr:hypothetical protein [Anaerolineae bacterium]
MVVLFRFLLKKWKLALVLFVVFDMLLVGGLVYTFAVQEVRRVEAAGLARLTVSPTATATATATPWPGPGRRVTPTPTLPATPLATDVLAESGFPVGFTPTPQPTREQVMITLPYINPVYRNNLDVPVINQIYYPEPFFPPGSNNACGPVALFAALQALGSKVEYSRLRDIAVANGFTSYGISKGGLVGTAAYVNQETGGTLQIEHGSRYGTKDLIREVRTGGVVIVLLNVQKAGGQFRVTPDAVNSFGHFLIVDSINLRSKTVQFAGSTLGMEKVPLADFVQSWSGSSQPVNTSGPAWQSFLRTEAADNWALVIRRKR